jgi:hypothetical protein
MAKMTRRAFLGGAAGLVAMASLGSWLAWRRNTPEVFVKTAVTRNLDGYAIAGDALDAFAADFLEAESAIMQTRGVQLAMRARQVFFSDIARRLAPRQQRYEMLWLERLIVTRFAQSTDLLYSDPGSRTIRYIRYWDPYVSGCANTLARFDFD